MRQIAPRAIALVGLAIGVGYLIVGRQYPVFKNDQPGPGLYPLLVGAFWVFTGVLGIIEVWRETPSVAAEIDWPDRRGWLRIGVVVICCVAYIGLVATVGDLIMSFVVMVAVMRAMGMTNPVRLVGISVGMSLVWHLIFVTSLHVPLPQGPLG